MVNDPQLFSIHSLPVTLPPWSPHTSHLTLHTFHNTTQNTSVPKNPRSGFWGLKRGRGAAAPDPSGHRAIGPSGHRPGVPRSHRSAPEKALEFTPTFPILPLKEATWKIFPSNISMLDARWDKNIHVGMLAQKNVKLLLKETSACELCHQITRRKNFEQKLWRGYKSTHLRQTNS